MKAFALTAAGQPATMVDLPVPEIADDGVRVWVRAASVNGFDVFEANGYLVAMMEHEFPTVIGRDFAGVVESVGSARTDVVAGEDVLGFIPSTPPLHDGTFAEVIGGASGLVLARKPAGVSFATAAAIPLAGATALGALDSIDVGPGDTVLIAGATGGVGSICVQLVAKRGATVIATAKPGGEDRFVRELGAAVTVDYSKGDVAQQVSRLYPDGMAALIDLVDRAEAFAPMAALVRDGGQIATTLGAADVEALAARNVRATNVRGEPTTEKLNWLAEQVAAGNLRVEIQATYPLTDAAAALAAFAAGTRGKIVLAVS